MLGGAAVIGTGAALRAGIKGKNRKIPSANTAGSSVGKNQSYKRFQNSEKVRKRLEALGGTAAGLNRNGRSMEEKAVIKNMQKVLAKKNAAKARKLRSAGNYFKDRLKLMSFNR